MIFNENGDILNEGFLTSLKKDSKDSITVDIIPFKSVGPIKFGTKAKDIKYDNITKNFMVGYSNDGEYNKIDKIQISKKTGINYNIQGVGIIDFDNLRVMMDKLKPLSYDVMNNYYISEKYGLVIFPDKTGEKIKNILVLNKM